MHIVRAQDIEFNYVRKGRGKEPLSPIQVESRVEERIQKEKLNLIYYGFTGEYKATNSRIVLGCKDCGRIRDITAKQFLNNPAVCPCKRSRYNNKYKKGSHMFYVMRSGDVGKVGMTSNILQRRHGLNCRNKRIFDIVFVCEYKTRQDAVDTETFVKHMFNFGECDLKCGRSESFVYNEKMVNSIKNCVAYKSAH